MFFFIVLLFFFLGPRPRVLGSFLPCAWSALIALIQVLLSAKNRSDLRSAVLSKWEQMHELYVHAEQPQDDRATEPPSMCQRWGMCVCSGLGLKSFRFHSALVKFLKPSFTPRRRSRKKQPDGTFKTVDLPPSEKAQQAVLTTHRLMLREAFIVLRLEHKSVCSATPEGRSPFAHRSLHPAWSDLAMRALGSAADASDVKTVWLHVGHVNFTTWNLAVLSLTEDAEERDDGCLRLSVGKPYKAADSLAFFPGTIDFTLNWNVTVFNIVSDDRVVTIPEMVPNWVLVKELKSVPAACFWKGWEIEEELAKAAQEKAAKERARKRKATATSTPTAKRARRPPGLQDARNDVDAEPDLCSDEEAANLPEALNEAGADSFLQADLELDADRAAVRVQDERFEYGLEDPDTSDLFETASQAESDDMPDDEDGLTRMLEEMFQQDEEKPQPAEPDSGAAAAPELPKEPASGSGSQAPRKPGAATTVVVVHDMGEIRWNKEQHNFMAVCRDPRHTEESECKRVRTANPPARSTGPSSGQGRPLGLLTAWLCRGACHDNARDHKESIQLLSRADRLAGRTLFMSCPGAADIAIHERDKRDGEDSEPEHLK